MEHLSSLGKGQEVECWHAPDELGENQERCFCVQEFGVPFMETSAKSGLNVELAFTAVAKWVTHTRARTTRTQRQQSIWSAMDSEWKLHTDCIWKSDIYCVFSCVKNERLGKRQKQQVAGSLPDLQAFVFWNIFFSIVHYSLRSVVRIVFSKCLHFKLFHI